MSYTPFEARIYPILIYYLVLSLFSIFMTVRMYQKYKERQVKPPLYMSIVFFFLTSALIVLTIGLIEAAITGYFKEIYRFSLPLAYTMVVGANIALFYFAINMTEEGEKLLYPLIIIGIVIVVLLFLPTNYWGVPSQEYEGLLNTRLFTTLVLVAYSYIIYIYIAYISYKAKNQTEDKIAHFGFIMLFLSPIWMIMFFMMFIFDTLLIAFLDHPGYSGFVYVAWIFGILFYVCMYLALVMPEWLVKRINKE